MIIIINRDFGESKPRKRCL